MIIVFHRHAGDGGEGRGRHPDRSAGSRGAAGAPAPRAGWAAIPRATIVKHMSGDLAQSPEVRAVDLVRIEPEAGRFRFYRLALQREAIEAESAGFRLDPDEVDGPDFGRLSEISRHVFHNGRARDGRPARSWCRRPCRAARSGASVRVAPPALTAVAGVPVKHYDQ